MYFQNFIDRFKVTLEKGLPGDEAHQIFLH